MNKTVLYKTDSGITIEMENKCTDIISENSIFICKDGKEKEIILKDLYNSWIPNFKKVSMVQFKEDFILEKQDLYEIINFLDNVNLYILFLNIYYI